MDQNNAFYDNGDGILTINLNDMTYTDNYVNLYELEEQLELQEYKEYKEGSF